MWLLGVASLENIRASPAKDRRSTVSGYLKALSGVLQVVDQSSLEVCGYKALRAAVVEVVAKVVVEGWVERGIQTSCPYWVSAVIIC